MLRTKIVGSFFLAGRRYLRTVDFIALNDIADRAIIVEEKYRHEASGCISVGLSTHAGVIGIIAERIRGPARIDIEQKVVFSKHLRQRIDYPAASTVLVTVERFIGGSDRTDNAESLAKVGIDARGLFGRLGFKSRLQRRHQHVL